MSFLHKVKKPLLLSYSSKTSTYKWIKFCQNPQNFAFGPFLGLIGPSWPKHLFSKNQTSSLFLPNDDLTSCKKIEKTNQTILRSYVAKRWTDGRTDAIIPLPRMSNKVTQKIMSHNYYLQNSIWYQVKNFQISLAYS